jgi:4-hydroxy-3-polyprenylbenzoate decarboxylase
MNLTVKTRGTLPAHPARSFWPRAYLRALEADERVGRVHFIASENSLRVLAEELGLHGRNDLLEKLLGVAPKKTVQHADADIGAAIASAAAIHPAE